MTEEGDRDLQDRIAGGVPQVKRLHRSRLAMLLDRIMTVRVALVVAPPGAGKTTLLADWAQRAPGPVLWCPADADNTSGDAFVAQLSRVASRQLGVAGGWMSLGDARRTLGAWDGPVVTVVIDDLHAWWGTEAEAALGRLISTLPSQVRVLAGARRKPKLNLSRARLEGDLIELGAEELRFRSWETEALFRQHYHHPMLPEEASTLTQRTEGWAAGLQLFHLATRDRSPAERSRLLGRFGIRSRLVGDYLADNVLNDLPPELAAFLVQTGPLGVLSANLCDALLARTGSAEVLAELERRELFVTSSDDGGSYHYHEIMRNHLDGLLVSQVGEAEARACHQRAGRLLLSTATAGELAGAAAAGFRALCRSESWEEAAAALRTRGEDLIGPGAHLIDGIPDHVIDADPWLQLATARRHLAAGRFDAALAAYRKSEPGLPRRMAATCQAELIAVSAWTATLAGPAPGWSADLRRGVARDPLASVPADAEGGDGRSMALAGFLVLLAGQMGRAAALLEQASLRLTDPVWDLTVRLAATAASMLASGGEAQRSGAVDRLLALAAEADRLGMPFVERLALALLALAGRPDVASSARQRCRAEGDQWGELLTELIEGAGRLMGGEAPTELMADAAQRAHRLGAGVLQAWALAAVALAEGSAGHPDAGRSAVAAERAARRAGVPGAEALCYLVQARREGPQAGDHARLAGEHLAACGLRVPWATGSEVASPPVLRAIGRDEAATGNVATGLAVRCFGELEVVRDGQALPLDGLRPRARAVLAVLALHWPRPVHVEVLIELLWPDADTLTGSRNLHTAVSSIRRVLVPLACGSEATRSVVRRGDAYVLVAEISDVADLDRRLHQARTARSAGDPEAERAALEAAAALHRGELLTEMGPAEWVIRERDRLRWEAADAAERLAELELAAGRAAAACAAARRGLDLDRHRESLWRLAIDAAEASHDRGVAASLRALQGEALAELGLTVA